MINGLNAGRAGSPEPVNVGCQGLNTASDSKSPSSFANASFAAGSSGCSAQNEPVGP